MYIQQVQKRDESQDTDSAILSMWFQSQEESKIDVCCIFGTLGLGCVGYTEGFWTYDFSV